MRNKLVLKLLAVVFGLALIGAACSDDSDTEATGDNTETTAAEESTETTEAEADTSEQTIVEIAAGNPDFTTLVELVTAADLAETLSGTGPFTVFAPTNEAFAKVPSDTLEQLAADPSGALTSVLQLHVIAGEVLAEDAVAAAGTCVDTLGGKVKVEEVDGELTIGGAKITSTDIQGSNGVIHVIDGVITAPSTDC